MDGLANTILCVMPVLPKMFSAVWGRQLTARKIAQSFCIIMLGTTALLHSRTFQDCIIT